MPGPRILDSPRATAGSAGGRWFLVVLAAALAAAWGMLAARVPLPLILPALSVCMVLAGFTLAAVLYLAGARATATASAPWEVACALVFLGFAAAILSDGGDAARVLDEINSRLAQSAHA
jgi:hypothetical protein